ncbi:MAG: DUF1015 domain-containing protein [Acidimicrobiia bacterium]
MPDFVPFRALRFSHGASLRDVGDAPADLSAVCSPPYDVIDDGDRAALLAEDPHNVVRLILPDSYDGAAEQLHAWMADGTLAIDDAPSFSVYRMTYTGDDGRPASTTGVIGNLGLDAGGVLPHERTLPKAKTDRLELLRTTRANLEPIWGISLAAGLTTLLESNDAPDAVATDDDGARHELFRVDDPERIAKIRAAVEGAGVVLADGHHRYETSSNYRDEIARGGTAAAQVGTDQILIYIVELADEQLCVRAIHRLVHGVADVDLRRALTTHFEVRDSGPNTPEGVIALEAAMHSEADGRGGLGLVDGQGLALLVPRESLDAAMQEEPAPLRDVDSARFDAGIRRVVPEATLTYRNDARTVAAMVANGAADAAVLLRPVSVPTIRAAAADGIRMPEKTTFFAPKPRTGMVMRLLDA